MAINQNQDPEAGEVGLDCVLSNGSTDRVTWDFIFANCDTVNPLCNSQSGAWVAAITVCNQGL